MLSGSSPKIASSLWSPVRHEPICATHSRLLDSAGWLHWKAVGGRTERVDPVASKRACHVRWRRAVICSLLSKPRSAGFSLLFLFAAGDRAALWAVAISPAGNWLAAAGQTGVISLWAVPCPRGDKTEELRRPRHGDATGAHAFAAGTQAEQGGRKDKTGCRLLSMPEAPGLSEFRRSLEREREISHPPDSTRIDSCESWESIGPRPAASETQGYGAPQAEASRPRAVGNRGMSDIMLSSERQKESAEGRMPAKENNAGCSVPSTHPVGSSKEHSPFTESAASSRQAGLKRSDMDFERLFGDAVKSCHLNRAVRGWQPASVQYGLPSVVPTDGTVLESAERGQEGQENTEGGREISGAAGAKKINACLESSGCYGAPGQATAHLSQYPHHSPLSPLVAVAASERPEEKRPASPVRPSGGASCVSGPSAPFSAARCFSPPSSSMFLRASQDASPADRRLSASLASVWRLALSPRRGRDSPSSRLRKGSSTAATATKPHCTDTGTVAGDADITPRSSKLGLSSECSRKKDDSADVAPELSEPGKGHDNCHCFRGQTTSDPSETGVAAAAGDPVPASGLPFPAAPAMQDSSERSLDMLSGNAAFSTNAGAPNRHANQQQRSSVCEEWSHSKLPGGASVDRTPEKVEEDVLPWFVTDRPQMCLTGHCAAIIQLVWAPTTRLGLLLSASLDKTVS